MTRIRKAAATFIETGRALGHLERTQALVAYLDECAERTLHLSPGSPVAADIKAMADFQRGHLKQLDREALDQRMTAERLITELEDPGGAIARRVLGAIAAARQAWRRG